MNLRDLKYLVAIDEHKSFRKAAEAVFVSQPTLSMQLKKLEDFLEVQLIERNNNNILLTQAGKEILEQAKIILGHEQSILNIANAYSDPLSGEVKIGAFPTLAPYYFPKIIPTLRDNFPNLTPYLIEEKTETLIEMLKQGSLDFAFLATPIKESEFETIDIFTEDFYLATSDQNELASKNMISSKDIEHKTLLLLSDGHCLRDQALEFCKLAGADENKSFRATSLETLRQMVIANVGITIIPEIAIKEDGLRYIKFDKNSKTSRTIALTYRKNSHRENLFREISAQIS